MRVGSEQIVQLGDRDEGLGGAWAECYVQEREWKRSSRVLGESYKEIEKK